MTIKRFVPLAVVTAILAAAFLWRPAGPSLCGVKQLSGLSCPGCGMIRSVTAFAQGRPEESIRYHLFGPLVLAALVVLWGALAAALVRGRPWRAPATPAFRATMAVALLLLVGYWGARVAAGAAP
jgi:hypothetical protein